MIKTHRKKDSLKRFLRKVFYVKNHDLRILFLQRSHTTKLVDRVNANCVRNIMEGKFD